MTTMAKEEVKEDTIHRFIILEEANTGVMAGRPVVIRMAIAMVMVAAGKED